MTSSVHRSSMRYLLLTVLLVVGCGEVSTAGNSGAAGAGGTDDTGTAGTTGAAGDQGTAGAGGTSLPPSCYIPLDQVNGTDPAAVLNRANGMPECANQTVLVQIIGGEYYDTSWTRTNYTVATVPVAGMCTVSMSYQKKVAGGNCGVPAGTEHLFVQLTVPAI